MVYECTHWDCLLIVFVLRMHLLLGCCGCKAIHFFVGFFLFQVRKIMTDYGHCLTLRLMYSWSVSLLFHRHHLRMSRKRYECLYIQVCLCVCVCPLQSFELKGLSLITSVYDMHNARECFLGD